uniref:RRM domain-containing protein n=1 Tax=Caenorhabditis japonica TaxID=281687 RepID=A0A8R1HMG5_CAEJA
MTASGRTACQLTFYDLSKGFEDTFQIRFREIGKTPSESGSRAASPAPPAASRSPATPSSSLPSDIDQKLSVHSQSPVKIEMPSELIPEITNTPTPPLPAAPPAFIKKEEIEVEEPMDMEIEVPAVVIPEEKPKPVLLVAPPGLVAPPSIVVPTPSFVVRKTEEIAVDEEEEEEYVEQTTSDGKGTQRVKISTSQRKKLKREKLNAMTFEEKMAEVLNRQKAIQNTRMADPVTFGALEDHLAWKDPSQEQQTAEENAKMLAIMGPGRGGDNVASMALALMDGGGALMLANSLKKKEMEAAAGAEPKRKSRRVKEKKKIQPKLNSAQALAAAAKAGEMSDALKNEVMNSEDASLASQEGLEIRGNDARHLLMTKLLRTNRSSVLILRNMVKPEDIDEYLEGEIREEASKFGTVVDVVIANFAANGTVKIFVKFADSMQVDRAKAAMDGRFFGGNTVKAEAYDQVLFDHADYTG